MLRKVLVLLFATACVEGTGGSLIPATQPVTPVRRPQPTTQPTQTIPMPQDVPLAPDPEPASEPVREAPPPPRAERSPETPYDNARRLFDSNYVPVPANVNKTWDSDDPAMKDDIQGLGRSGERISGQGTSGSISGQGKSGPITGKGKSGSITGKGTDGQ